MIGLFLIGIIIALALVFVWFRLPQYRGWITAAGVAIGTAFGAAWEWISNLFGGV